MQGKDYDRVRMLEVGADEAERYERKKRKKNPDLGFSTYEDATIRYCRVCFKMIFLIGCFALLTFNLPLR